MPTGSYTRRMAENEFKPKGSMKMAIEWLEWVAHNEGIYIRHQVNGTEKCIGGGKLAVDGFTQRSKPSTSFMAAVGTDMIVRSTAEKKLMTNARNRWLIC